MNATRKRQANEAVRLGALPRRTRGHSLVLDVPGARYRTLVSAAGEVTPFGDYYYDRIGDEAPRLGFDYDTEPYRRRKRELINMSDGKEVAVRSWDNTTRNWKFTKTGRVFYRNSMDRYIINIPAVVHLQRKNGTWYTREDSLPNTATPLGEISVPTTIT